MDAEADLVALTSEHPGKAFFQAHQNAHRAQIAARKALMSLRPKHDLTVAREALRLAQAQRAEARARLSRASNALAGAEAAVAEAEAAVAAFADLDDEVADLYASQMAAGAAPAITAELLTRTHARRDAVQHQAAVTTATARLRQNVAADEAAVKLAESRVAAAVMMLLAGEGEALVERCDQLRRDFEAARCDLFCLSAVWMGGKKMTISRLWIELVNYVSRAPSIDPAGVAEWQARAHALAAGDAEP